MDSGSFDLSSVCRITAFGKRIILTEDLSDIPVFIFNTACAGHKIGAFEPDFIARIQAFVFIRRDFHKVLFFDPEVL